jgi:hypothetical protein
MPANKRTGEAAACLTDHGIAGLNAPDSVAARDDTSVAASRSHGSRRLVRPRWATHAAPSMRELLGAVDRTLSHDNSAQLYGATTLEPREE